MSHRGVPRIFRGGSYLGLVRLSARRSPGQLPGLLFERQDFKTLCHYWRPDDLPNKSVSQSELLTPPCSEGCLDFYEAFGGARSRACATWHDEDTHGNIVDSWCCSVDSKCFSFPTRQGSMEGSLPFCIKTPRPRLLYWIQSWIFGIKSGLKARKMHKTL